jgi:hypothetical protein
MPGSISDAPRECGQQKTAKPTERIDSRRPAATRALEVPDSLMLSTWGRAKAQELRGLVR